MRIVLKQEKKDYVLEKPLPQKAPPSNASHTERNAYQKHKDDALDASCLMLATMNSDLQKQFENVDAYDMIMNLKNLFQEQARTERYQTVKTLIECKLASRSSVSPHVIKMIGYIENLERLGSSISQKLATNIII